MAGQDAAGVPARPQEAALAGAVLAAAVWRVRGPGSAAVGRGQRRGGAQRRHQDGRGDGKHRGVSRS